MVIAAQQEMKEEGVPITLMAGVMVPGTYKRDGKKLVLKNTDNQEIPFYAE